MRDCPECGQPAVGVWCSTRCRNAADCHDSFDALEDCDA